MTQCPTCKLLMESHSSNELMDCCLEQISDTSLENDKNCPNCKYKIEDHKNQELLECTLAFLK